jgi:2-polyprenyl-6-methoxyphenol hydroxylase-like FAD-dependent oxidoreductase
VKATGRTLAGDQRSHEANVTRETIAMTERNGRPRYDAIVVGARCAGSPTAMLLARRGHEVLVVDRAHFPSDTVSTHLIHPPGVAALDRWGLLDRVVGTGCPPINTYSFDFGPFTITGSPLPVDGVATAYCPRRTLLDQVLVDAARDAGAELREGFTVDELLVEEGLVVGIHGHGSDGGSVTERARVVIGADGAHSRVAAAVGADRYNDQPALAVAYYSYWSGIPVDRACWTVRPGHGYGAFPTNEGLTLLLAAWPHDELAEVKSDIEGNYLRAVQDAFGERLRGARRQGRIMGSAVANHFRTPFGPGWALVGDAGYLKDPVTAQGMSDAFIDAESCATALDDAFRGARTFDEALADHQQRRDARVAPIYDFTTQIARLEPPPPELQHLLGAIAGNARAMDEFASVVAGTLSPADFFDREHIGRLVSSAT